MKNLTFNQKRTYVRKLIEKYANQLNTPIPTLRFKAGSGKRTQYHEDMLVYGSNYNNGEEIFINLNLHRHLSDYDNTVAHEFLHTIKPNLPHGMLFDNYIKQIRRGENELAVPFWTRFLDKLTWSKPYDCRA